MKPINHFVRNILGCECPDTVLQELSYEFPPHLRCRLQVEQRLLVDVVEVDSFCAVMARLPPLLKEGRQLRDKLGMKRFRLVLSSREPMHIRSGAYLVWSTQGNDANTHLHVLERTQCEEYLPGYAA